MPLLLETETTDPKGEDLRRLQRCWLWLLVLGIAVMVVGFLAVGAAFLTTFTTILVFGVLLIAGGVIQIVNAFLARSWRGFAQYLLGGVLHLILGVLMVDHPLLAAGALTLLLAVAFLAGGVFRIVVALSERFPGWGWVLTNGVITLLLGIAIWRRWPEDSLWVIGLFVGIDLIMSGLSWVMLGIAVKAVAPPPAPTNSQTSPPAGVGHP